MSNDQNIPRPITVTYPDKATAQQVVNLIVRKNPIGWSRKSHATYFREEYALSIKKILDGLEEDKKPRVLRLDQYPSMSINSLYLFINQASHFLREYMDKDSKYSKQWQSLKIEKHKGIGVTIKYKDFMVENFNAEVFVPHSDTPKWKRELDLYLNDEKIVKPFHKDGLMLTPLDMATINNELSDLMDAGLIQYVVTSKEIKIMKTTPIVP